MWLALAISASVLWGVTYALYGQLLKSLSVPTVLGFMSGTAAAVMLTVSLVSGKFGMDMRTLQASPGLTRILLGCVVVTLLANVAISYSIAGRNATLAAVVEIAYPLFTVLATWLLFGEKQLTSATLVGGLLIFAGASVIALKSA